MGDPLVSVMVATYNHENFIRQCLEGIMMQKTNFGFDVIVGEDCSTDKTRDIVREFETKYPDIIRPIYHENNVGASRNVYDFCFPNLTGKYIAICEGDDFWTDPFKLQKQIDFLEQHPGCSFCFHRVNVVDQHSKMITKREPAADIKLHSRKDIFHISIPTLSVVFRNCITVFPEEMFNVKSGDTFLFALLSCYGDAADLGFVGASYRKHMGGIYSHKTLFEQYKQTIQSRNLMKCSPIFTVEQKREIEIEVLKRKARYVKVLLRKKQLLNCLKIILC